MLPARVQRAVIRACGRKRFVDWAFGHYLGIAPPEFAQVSGSRLRHQVAATSGRPAQVAETSSPFPK
jgi:hypothetical protein